MSLYVVFGIINDYYKLVSSVACFSTAQDLKISENSYLKLFVSQCGSLVISCECVDWFSYAYTFIMGCLTVKQDHVHVLSVL